MLFGWGGGVFGWFWFGLFFYIKINTRSSQVHYLKVENELKFKNKTNTTTIPRNHSTSKGNDLILEIHNPSNCFHCNWVLQVVFYNCPINYETIAIIPSKCPSICQSTHNTLLSEFHRNRDTAAWCRVKREDNEKKSGQDNEKIWRKVSLVFNSTLISPPPPPWAHYTVSGWIISLSHPL